MDELLELAPEPPSTDTLAFQEFRSSSAASRSASSSVTSNTGLLRPSQPAGGGATGFEEPTRAPSGAVSVWSLKYYAHWFDVDSADVSQRVLAAVLPRPRGAFFLLVEERPDLWGPFWISTSLIFATALSGNLAGYLSFAPTAAQPVWTADFNHLPLAVWLVYSYVSWVPALLWLALQFYGAPKPLAQVLCVYGYSTCVFVPVCVLCVLPSSPLRWLLVAAGGGLSGLFLLSNVAAHLQDGLGGVWDGPNSGKVLAILGGMAAAHGLLVALLKSQFFA